MPQPPEDSKWSDIARALAAITKSMAEAEACLVDSVIEHYAEAQRLSIKMTLTGKEADHVPHASKPKVNTPPYPPPANSIGADNLQPKQTQGCS
jgi:hypothetical protein